MIFYEIINFGNSTCYRSAITFAKIRISKSLAQAKSDLKKDWRVTLLILRKTRVTGLPLKVVLRGQRGQLFLFSMQIEDVISAYIIMKVKKDVLMS